jgi:hypothetical protein
MTTPEQTPASTGPPKKETRPCRTALSVAETTPDYHGNGSFQPSLERRLNRVAGVGEVMPSLLARILAQSFGLGGSDDDAD